VRPQGGRRLLLHPAAGHAGAGEDEADRRASDRRRAPALIGRRRRALGAAFVVAFALSACASDAPSSDAGTHDDGDDHAHDEAPAASFPAAEASSEVATTLSDYAFIGLPASVEGPNVLFRATIRGGNEHELVIVADGGATVGAITPFRAGDGERTLAAVLEAGSYTVQCLVKEGTRTHAQLGMRRDLTVEAG
jgi:hypothetical protein